MSNRITTRRARACDPRCQRPGDIEIAQTDQGELNGISFDAVEVVCTFVDIGDPRFRRWLCHTLGPRMRYVHGVTLTLIAGVE